MSQVFVMHALPGGNQTGIVWADRPGEILGHGRDAEMADAPQRKLKGRADERQPDFSDVCFML